MRRGGKPTAKARGGGARLMTAAGAAVARIWRRRRRERAPPLLSVTWTVTATRWAAWPQPLFSPKRCWRSSTAAATRRPRRLRYSHSRPVASGGCHFWAAGRHRRPDGGGRGGRPPSCCTCPRCRRQGAAAAARGGRGSSRRQPAAAVAVSPPGGAWWTQTRPWCCGCRRRGRPWRRRP